MRTENKEARKEKDREKIKDNEKMKQKEKDQPCYLHVTHTFQPVFNGESRVLILGTFPSVKSREGMFYYHHPQNRFWKVIAGLCGEETPQTIEEKKEILLRNRIAIWDVIESCDIIGSSDSSIKNVTPADLNRVLSQANIRGIFGNGQKACTLYRKYCQKAAGRDIICLPSTSPANAACSLERLLERWEVVKSAVLSKEDS